LRHLYPWQTVKQRKRSRPIPQSSESKFGGDERMNKYLPLAKKPTHIFASRAQVINPNRGIGEDQFDFALRRGIGLSSGMVPPRDANRRALSRSINALRASRTSAVFSATPVNSRAVRRRSSSKAMVVLIGTYYIIK
jgi:hypothetical protein